MADHTSWRAYCRRVGGPCMAAVPRLTRKAAREFAQEHHQQTGHPAEVAKLQFTVMDTYGKDS